MIAGGENPRAAPQRDMRRFVVNRETAAKLAAVALVAIALVVSLPALMESEQPAPLPPDVGLPQAPAPLPAPSPAPKPAAPRRAAKPRKEHHMGRKRRHHEHHEHHQHAAEAPAAPAAPPVYVPPSGTREDFGFEQPRP
jgi:hypothetical protein